MKKLFLIIVLLNIYTSTFSQVVFQVVSNPCNPTLEQAYPLVYVDTLSNWNCPDITNPSNAIQGELAFVNDGTTPGVFTNIGTPPLSVETTTDACDSATWTQDLTGKIAVIWRGTCEYSCKAEKAQSKGAIGVIIINHTGSATGMGGGTCGINVSIPVIMIGREDGENLMSCISAGGMVGFIGNSNGAFADDLGSSMADILMTENSAIPWDLAQNGTEYPVDFGIWAYNKGANPQTGVIATVDVTYNGISVYTQTATPVNFAGVDTTYRDSNYFDLGTYAPALWNLGTYTVTYTILNIGDQFLSDNTFLFDFKFTNNEDVYAKCRLDSFNQPIHNVSLSIDDGYACDFEICIAFKNEYAGTRNAMVKGMTLSSSPIGFNIENEPVMIKAYQWNDIFTDINSPATFNNLSLLDSSFYIYPDNTLIDSNIFLPFNFPIALQDNQRYLFCVFKPDDDSLRIGYDTQLDYTTTVNYYLQPISPLSGIHEPNYDTKIWDIKGLDFNAIPAISLNMDIATNVNEAKKETTFYPYPNPTTNLLTIPLRQRMAGKVQLEVFDVLGKIVLSENQTLGNEPLKVNVAAILNGNYLFKLTFSDGTSDVFKVSINR